MRLIILFLAIFCRLEALPPMSVIYHPITTDSKEAQNAFNDALAAYFAFDYEGAYIYFKRCSEIDPEAAMAYFGLALSQEKLASGTIDSERQKSKVDEKSVLQWVTKAKNLSKNVSPNEKAYIEAVSLKFSGENGLKLYNEAMETLVTDFPDDLDGAIFFAESILDCEHWVMWKDGVAKPEATRVVELLESVLKRDPEHLGANHYFIHTMESGHDYLRALSAANYLYHADTKWGHYIHSASHIFLPLGYYQEAVSANRRSIEVDKSYTKNHPDQKSYRNQSIRHESFYLWMALLWEENYTQALKVAKEIERLVTPLLETHPDVENDLLIPLKTLIYFHRWEEILALKEPSKNLNALNLFWHFARGLAFAHLNNVEKAEKETDYYKVEIEKFKSPISFYQFRLAEGLLNAMIAHAKGNLDECIEKLKELSEKQDNISMLEWFYPFRQTLGAKLIEAGDYKAAEATFRKCLSRYVRNGRALFGLSEALLLQNKDNFWSKREAEQALRFSDRKLTLKDL